jgi:hypothetical protein
MFKLTIYLLFSVFAVLLLDIFSYSFPFADLELFKNSYISKTALGSVLGFIGVYFSLSFLNKANDRANLKFYAERISTQEFEKQKRYFTQLKLSELYRSKEYQELSMKKMNQPYMPYEEITFSDESN